MSKKADGVDTDLATQEQIAGYARAEADLTQMRVPVLLHASNPRERLYIAAQDGTGNSLYKDAPENRSIVARVYREIEELKDQGIKNIASGYVEGIYTQDNPLKRIPDGVNGYTFERRVETAYHQFCEQAYNWLEEDPNAQIRVMGIGFSRGAEQTAALTRMIEQRGIQNPTDAKIVRDGEGLITHAEYTKPPLVAPGKTIQAALLLDPVSTGIEEHDRRLPPSVMSVLQVTAEHERRDLFKSTDHIPAGLSEDGRALNVTVSGAHSDVGNTYAVDGLGVLSYNLAAQYMNRVSDQPILQLRPVPENPDLFRIHHSEQHAFFYRTSGYDADGLRDHVNGLGPDALCRTGEVRECHAKDPMSPELELQLERRIGSPSIDRTYEAAAPKSDLDRMIDQLYAASLSGDDVTWSKALESTSQQFMASPEGQAWEQEVQRYGEIQRAQDALQQQQWEQQQQLQEAPAHRPHAIRM
ncbi:phospholipase effector Tle1 domain-containing protein [Variovorax sp. Sphag1AA]|uniref:phospholipase effector Tle1 domain-containing protein n=1 Tax=Variovorax sp. Sphag1AA TaxID=2587027 RepID=UPI0016200AC3|nr:DUF2235 domain-containing protein [Variovorax sp. Sphag1AA]MBB3179474.1 hypothetical protein [Variovorax sp. Sphag1AA]